MQSQQQKLAEIERRRNSFWNAAAHIDEVRCLLPQRRAFFAGASLNGLLQAPVLEIGAEYAINGLVIESEMGMAMASVDLSTETLQSATIFARILGYQPPSLRMGADAERLPFVADSFRTVIVWDLLHLFGNTTTLLSEIWRVLAPGGHLIIGEEPIRRRLTLPLIKTKPIDRLGSIGRLLTKAHLLPWVARIGAADGGNGVGGVREFRHNDLPWLLRRFAKQEWHYQPQDASGRSSAGPLGRWLWRNLKSPGEVNASLTKWFGGSASGWARKPETLSMLSPGHYLLRKHPDHDRIALRGYVGAFLCDGETLKVSEEVAMLPEATRGRSLVLLDLPRDPIRIELFDAEGKTPVAAYRLRNEQPGKPDESLACPDCVVFTENCIYGLCENQCIKACPKDALAPTDPAMPVRNSCDGCGLCLRACPYGGLDRPRLNEERCPECRRQYPRGKDIVECRPKELQTLVGDSRWSEMLRF